MTRKNGKTLESEFISTWMYFRTFIGDFGPRKLSSGRNALLPMEHGISLKGCSSGGLHRVMSGTAEFSSWPGPSVCGFLPFSLDASSGVWLHSLKPEA